MRSTATDTLSRQLRAGIEDSALAELVIALHRDERLSLIQEDTDQQEPMILCTLGLYDTD